MIDTQDTKPEETKSWLELANGGGVMLRAPTALVLSSWLRMPRPQKQLTELRTALWQDEL